MPCLTTIKFELVFEIVCKRMADKVQTKFYKFVEWVVFICLLGLAAYFMIGVLEHYFSKKSSFTQSENQISELPTITMCFSSNGEFDGDVELKFGSDFNILYETSKFSDFNFKGYSGYLKEGHNLFNDSETLILKKLTTRFSGICYKITSISHSSGKGVFRKLIWYFKESISHEDLPFLKIYSTSEKNSYGLTQVVWFDGKVKQTLIKSGVFKQINFKPQQTNYLKITTNCKDESYFECFEKLYMQKLNNSCKKKCTPYSLPTVPVCKNDMEIQCAKIVYDELYGNLSYLEVQCPQSCSILQYSGEESWTGKVLDYYVDNATHALDYSGFLSMAEGNCIF